MIKISCFFPLLVEANIGICTHVRMTRPDGCFNNIKLVIDFQFPFGKRAPTSCYSEHCITSHHSQKLHSEIVFSPILGWPDKPLLFNPQQFLKAHTYEICKHLTVTTRQSAIIRYKKYGGLMHLADKVAADHSHKIT